MLESDITEFPAEFEKQGWHKPIKQYQMYYNEQENGTRKLFVAEVDGNAAGYATLLSRDISPPFKDKNIPVIVDFNVLEKYQRNGVGTAIMDAIENCVKEYSPVICLGVGLHYATVLHKGCMSSVDIFPTAAECGLMVSAWNSMPLA